MNIARRDWLGELRQCDVQVFKPGSWNIRADSVLRLQGYRDPARIRPAIRKAAEAMASRACQLVRPEIHHRSIDVCAVGPDSLLLEDGTRFDSGAFDYYLPTAKRVVAIIGTLGSAFDDEVGALIERFEPLEALLLESAGRLAIESVSKAFSDELRIIAARNGLRVTARMAPGYTYRIDGREIDWPLEQQRQLFGLFSGHELPVRLLPSCVMVPKMSRSALYGLVPAGE